MTGLVRKATLFGVCGLLAASAALANVPDPTTSTVPNWLFAVGVLSTTGQPDVDGANGPAGLSNVITIKDFSGQPISGVLVSINLPCDFNLCDFDNLNGIPGVLNPWKVNCPDSVKVPSQGTLSGRTDINGQFKFAILAAAKDRGLVVPTPNPGSVFGGGGLNSTVIKVAGYAGTFAVASTVALDQNGSALVTGVYPGNGVTAGDASVALNQAFGFLLGGQKAALYRARSDHDCNGLNTAADAGAQLSQFFRVALLGATSTCPGAAFCTIKNPFPNNCP